MTACEVSVVIPTRDRWELLSRGAPRSALTQEGVEHDVIVDDGSTENSAARLVSLDKPRLKVVPIWSARETLQRLGRPQPASGSAPLTEPSWLELYRDCRAA